MPTEPRESRATRTPQYVVGQEVLEVWGSYSDPRFKPRIVSKVGRKWAHLKHDRDWPWPEDQFNMETGFLKANSSQIFPDRATYEAHRAAELEKQERHRLWGELRKAVPYSLPDHMTIDSIQAVIDILSNRNQQEPAHAE